MRSVRLKMTQVPGVFWGDDSRVYELQVGTEVRCSRCGQWAQTVFRWGQESVCGEHVRVTSRTRIRVTTTFAWRAYRTGTTEPPAAIVMRRGDEFAVAGPPERCGKYDKFMTPDRDGFVLVPRSRWAWA
ncbi:hypothetical protein J8F10_05510 [Gemmata sp. G18]|uniref:Uncharacterized protein n=1 Tax=Gemmata palustris TaxID=2822762 RepID=A0ABS5BM27_9BACT|nr:hypothetical protein [Gemmata palustris]MBP3954741.1 hypothetical protein [Gemmata palustris]